jgi:16S rRNA (adenine1518-N6/adenine1519-N6)-dimethyltransferase
MNLLKETKELCDLYHIKPARSKGQNFLVNEDVYQAVIDAADLKKSDTVLEVGPGLGFLTKLLAGKVERVVAVELDPKLAMILPTRLQSEGIKNVEVIQMNVLDFEKSKHKIKGAYKIVANLPYNISSVFLRKFLETDNRPQTMTLMLQREVAERIAAKPGEMSLLGLSVQFYAETKIMALVEKKDFWPEPEVRSAVINLKIKDKPVLSEAQAKDFFRLLKFGFSAKRKMLKNNLASGLKLGTNEVEKMLIEAGLSATCRPQDLGLEEWVKIFNLIGK